MELLEFGHGGARVIAYPTSQGRFYEWEDRGMVDALREHLDRGWIQLYCVDAVDSESWYAHHRPLDERARRQDAYERYVLDEVIPLTWHKNRTPYLIVTGASFGAYHAVDLALRHPGAVNRVIGLSGLYDIKQLTRGHSSEPIYHHDPSHFMIHEHDPGRIEALRKLDIIMAIGRDDPHRQDNEHLSGVLWSKGIWNALRIWDGWCHDWPWWRDMIRRYIGGVD